MTYALNTMLPHGLKLRIVVATRVALCWFLGLALPALFGSEGFWLAKLMFVASLPFMLAAALVAFTFPAHIAVRPVLWAVVATAIGIVAGWMVAGLAGAHFATMTTLPAAAAFVGSSKVWPFTGIDMAAEPQTDLP